MHQVSGASNGCSSSLLSARPIAGRFPSARAGVIRHGQSGEIRDRVLLSAHMTPGAPGYQRSCGDGMARPISAVTIQWLASIVRGAVSCARVPGASVTFEVDGLGQPFEASMQHDARRHCAHASSARGFFDRQALQLHVFDQRSLPSR